MNTSDECTLETRLNIIDTFEKKLEIFGYSKAQRREIIESGLVGYKVKIMRQEGKRHRRGTDTKKKRLKKKLSGKTSWFNVFDVDIVLNDDIDD